MKKYLKNISNFSFGSTSALTTNISIVIGLGSGNVSKIAIIGSLLVIALADNISDSLGVHMFKESEAAGFKESFKFMVGNFTARLLISLTFVFIILIFPMLEAQIITFIWGVLLLSILSYLIACKNYSNPYKETLKHLAVSLTVIALSKLMGTMLLHNLKF